jgi:hypothetical protein
MSQVYHNDLLRPFLELPQGEKVQAECAHSYLIPPYDLDLPFSSTPPQMSGSMETVDSAQKQRYARFRLGGSSQAHQIPL